MTISTTTNRVNYTGNDSTTAFSTTFRFLQNADLKVYLDGTLKTITTHYSVTGAGEDAGGTVTFVTAPGDGVVVTIKNDPARTQETDYVENDPFPAEAHESALDKLTILVQSVGEKADRAVTFAVDSSTTATMPEPEADKFIGWDATGVSLQNKEVVSSSTEIVLPLTIANGGTGSQTAADARTALGCEAADATILKEADIDVKVMDYVFSAQGSMVYASGASNTTTELPIGTYGQVLTVSSSGGDLIPAWGSTGTLSVLSTETSTGTWNITGLTAYKPLYITFNISGGSAPYNCKIQGAVSNVVNGVASEYLWLGTDTSGTTYYFQNVLFFLPTSTSVSMTISSITAGMTLQAIQ